MISSVNVTKSAVTFTEEILKWKTSFFVQWTVFLKKRNKFSNLKKDYFFFSKRR